MDYSDQGMFKDSVNWGLKKHASMKKDHANWSNRWDRVGTFVSPNKDEAYKVATDGDNKNKTSQVFDSTPTRYNRKLANGLYTLLTNPTIPWFEFTSGDQKVDDVREHKVWLQKAERKTRNVINSSNFGTECHSVYEDIPSFCTAVLFMHEDEENIVRFEADQIYNCHIGEGSNGMVNAISREIKWPMSKIVDEFGDKWMDESFAQEYSREMQSDCVEKDFIVVHIILPWSEKLGGRRYKKQKYVQMYILKDKKVLLEKSFFEEFPVAVPRWVKLPKEKYGRGPGIDTLPDIMTLNQMKKVWLMGAQMAVAPPLQTTDNSLVYPPNFKPFGMNYRRPGSDELKPIISNTRPDIGMEIIDSIKTDLKESWLIDQLQIVENDRMTATEIIQRRDEQFKSFGAVLGRLNNELLRPVIDRVFFLIAKAGGFEEIPPTLAEALNKNNLKIRYTSMIARAQESIEAEALNRALNASASVIQVQPQVMDLLDGDLVLRRNMTRYGVDADLIRKDTDIKAIREQRAQQQQAEAQAMANKSQSETMKNTAQAASGV